VTMAYRFARMITTGRHIRIWNMQERRTSFIQPPAMRGDEGMIVGENRATKTMVVNRFAKRSLTNTARRGANEPGPASAADHALEQALAYN